MSNADLAALADEYWQFICELQPTASMMRGDHRFDDRMEDPSEDAEEEAKRRYAGFAARAAAVSDDVLEPDDRVTKAVLQFLATNGVRMADSRMGEWSPVSHTMGLHVSLFNAFPQLPIVEPAHADNLVRKLEALAEVIDAHGERLQAGVSRGRTPMASTAVKSVAQIDDYLASPTVSDPLIAARAPATFDEAAETEWRQRLEEVLRDTVRPAFARYRDTIRDEVAPAGRSEDEPGLTTLPGGANDYRRLVNYHTTLPLDPEQIHQTGLDVIERLGAEYRQLGSRVLATADLDEVYRRLRDDTELHYDTAEEIVADSEAAMAKAKAVMGDWFGRLPQADCIVQATEVGPLAFYFRPAADGSRPGVFFVNTADPSGWGRHEIEAIAYHEGIPGHHLQLAIAGELVGIPDFRKHAFINAYGEGWGLYAERVADEMGLYTSDLTRIGMLSTDSMRGSRLVVDTGLHAMGWSREKAITFMVDNSPMTRSAVANEVDRYIAMPGQALGYMIGRLEINRLRAEAENVMGKEFDLKGFHDTVLGSGLVPLPVLGDLVRGWAGTAGGT